jgi:hypothetical protein
MSLHGSCRQEFYGTGSFNSPWIRSYFFTPKVNVPYFTEIPGWCRLSLRLICSAQEHNKMDKLYFMFCPVFFARYRKSQLLRIASQCLRHFFTISGPSALKEIRLKCAICWKWLETFDSAVIGVRGLLNRCSATKDGNADVMLFAFQMRHVLWYVFLNRWKKFQEYL